MGGFFGAASRQDCVLDVFYGTDYHSHLGTQRGGMVTQNKEGLKRNIHDITNTPFRTKFEDEIPKHSGNLSMGVISDYEDQPLLIGSHHGFYAIATVGKIENLNELVTEAVNRHAAHFTELKGNEFNQTELVASLINQRATFVEGIRYAQEAIKGSCSMLLLTRDGLYAARDRLGRTPVIIGKKADGYAITQESCALFNLGYQVDRNLGPGEVVKATPDGVEQIAKPGDKLQICSFLWIYYGYPASEYEGVSVEGARNRCGEALARRDDTEVDLVAGIPDSGVGHAIGYAAEKCIAYRRPFVKYTPTWPRSFMPQDQRVRDLVARMKLIPIVDLIKGKRLLFCEDSIVRGTQLKDIIQRLFSYGAREVHMRPACPPLVYGCRFLNFSRSKSEMDLAARKAIDELGYKDGSDLASFTNPDSERYQAMVERIRARLALTTLKYQRLDDMIRAIGLPQEKLCTYCWSGKSLS
jgi:amidophosphoribosyltransferase